MQSVSRTIYSSYLQTCGLMNLPFLMQLNTTLNELFNVESGIAPSTMPSLGYFAIGNGGHRMTVGANNIPKVEPIQHSGIDAALYNHMPFVLREIANDIGPVERAKYAMRRQETHNSAQYIAYYLKRLPLQNVIADMEYIQVANGVKTATLFQPNSSNLNPQPPALNSTGVNIVSGDYAAASAKLKVILTADEVAEILNAATIIYGDPSYAIISEIALCSGVDKAVQSPAFGNQVITFNDAICVQVLSFISSFFALQFNNTGSELDLDLGSSEPVFSLI